jgi:negative regulator of genetic competence, sporulation and motility
MEKSQLVEWWKKNSDYPNYAKRKRAEGNSQEEEIIKSDDDDESDIILSPTVRVGAKKQKHDGLEIENVFNSLKDIISLQKSLGILGESELLIKHEYQQLEDCITRTRKKLIEKEMDKVSS